MAQQTINIGTANNAGDGEGLRSAFDKCNDNFTELYNQETDIKEVFGFGYYVDSLTTPTITIDTSWTQITIDALGSNVTDYLPLAIRGTGHLLVSSVITPIAAGDDFDGRLDLTIDSKSGSPSYMEIILDFGNSTPDTSRAFTGYLQSAKTPPFKQSLPLDFFAGSTFLANGGKIYARTDAGSFDVSIRNIKLTRKGADLG